MWRTLKLESKAGLASSVGKTFTSIVSEAVSFYPIEMQANGDSYPPKQLHYKCPYQF